jgi:hypothetical protein
MNTDWKELATRARAALTVVCDAPKCSECEAAQGESGCVVYELDQALKAEANQALQPLGRGGTG